MSQMEDKERGKQSVVAAATVASEGPKTFEIEISNPFFTGPQNIMLADLTAPKTAAKG